MERRRLGRQRPLLVVSDIDNTLIGPNGGVGGFARWLASVPNAIFCIATGRRLDSALQVLRAAGAPLPAACVTAVGTEIHYGANGTFRACHLWPRILYNGWNAGAVRRLLDGPGPLRMQAHSEQTPFKLSYFAEDASRAAEHIAARLHTAGLEARVVVSHRNMIDVLAPRAGKAAAVAHLSRYFGIAAGQVIVAGDSGNDLDMLAAGHRAIVVSNHEPALARLRGSRGVYFSPHPHALGLLDGLRHHMGPTEKPGYEEIGGLPR